MSSVSIPQALPPELVDPVMAERRPGGAIAAQRLREVLVKSRKRAGLTQSDVIKELDWSESKMHRIESGPQLVSTSDVLAMLGLYGIPPDEQTAIVQLARDSRDPSFSTDFKKDVSAQFATYLDYEAYAARVFNYQTKVAPGPTQIGGYAESIMRVFGETTDDDEILRRVHLRERRAEKLLAPDGPHADFVIDESALHRAVGGEESSRSEQRYGTMIRLFENLKKINTVAIEPAKRDPMVNPNVSIRIVPFEYGIYPAFKGPFVILEFDKSEDEHFSFSDQTRLYLEWPGGEEFTAEERKVARYSSYRDELLGSTPPAEQTADILDYIQSGFESRVEHFPAEVKARSIGLTTD